MKNTYVYVAERGFTALEIVLSLALVGVIGVAGSYAYKNSTEHAASTASVIATSSPVHKATASPVATTSAPVLAFKELGVEITLTRVISDLQYTYFPAAGSSDGHAGIGLTSSALKASGASCATDTVSLGTVTVYKSGETVSRTGAPAQPIEQSGASKVGTNYYLYQTGQDSCATTFASSAVLNKQLAGVKQVVATLKQY